MLTDLAVDPECKRGSAGAPENETEVTDETIRAASAALRGFYLGDGRYDLNHDCFAAICRAVISAQSPP